MRTTHPLLVLPLTLTLACATEKAPPNTAAMPGADAPASNAPASGVGQGNRDAGGAADQTPPASTGGAGAPASSAASRECSRLERCAVESPCATGLQCITVRSCGFPVCITHQEACQLECGRSTCALLESMPAQISCQG